jgi:CDP-diacylglycerol--glycerol-3-phosphate 3-phosphatidyltransferase
MKRHLPFALTTLRLLLGPIALDCALTNFPRWIYLPILITATLSDIYDGILARRYGVATPALRRYDSITDVIYYLFILGAAFVLCKTVITQNWPLIALTIVALVTNLEIIAIHFLMNTPPVDVKSIFAMPKNKLQQRTSVRSDF